MRISDWSSDVCSSDLCQFVHDEVAHRREVDRFDGSSLGKGCECFEEPLLVELYALAQVVRENQGCPAIVWAHLYGLEPLLEAIPVLRCYVAEIGRASCRERVCQYV